MIGKGAFACLTILALVGFLEMDRVACRYVDIISTAHADASTETQPEPTGEAHPRFNIVINVDSRLTSIPFWGDGVSCDLRLNDAVRHFSTATGGTVTGMCLPAT